LRKQSKRFTYLFLLLLFASAGRVFADKPPALQSLAWLAGCWAGAGELQYFEQWMAPEGGLMLGMSRTIRPGKPPLFEYVRIVEEEGKLYYIARPSNQPEARFELTKSSSLEFVFENPAHDFPQRIIYRLQTDGSLLARIEGKSNGKDHAVDFPMKRAQCAGESAVCTAE
jgi:hypothetical protein